MIPHDIIYLLGSGVTYRLWELGGNLHRKAYIKGAWFRAIFDEWNDGRMHGIFNSRNTIHLTAQ